MRCNGKERVLPLWCPLNLYVWLKHFYIHIEMKRNLLFFRFVSIALFFWCVFIDTLQQRGFFFSFSHFELPHLFGWSAFIRSLELFISVDVWCRILNYLFFIFHNFHSGFFFSLSLSLFIFTFRFAFAITAFETRGMGAFRKNTTDKIKGELLQKKNRNNDSNESRKCHHHRD